MCRFFRIDLSNLSHDCPLWSGVQPGNILIFSVPSSPLNITSIHMTNTSVTLHWSQPDSPNGKTRDVYSWLSSKFLQVLSISPGSQCSLFSLLIPGIILGYRLYFVSKQVTDVVTVKDSSKEIVYQLKHLGNIRF